MAKFIIIYYPGVQHANTSPEEGAEGQAKFGAWLAGLGDAVVDPGTPLGVVAKRKTITPVQTAFPTAAATIRLWVFPSFKPTAWMPPSAWPRTARWAISLDMGKVEVAEMMEM